LKIIKFLFRILFRILSIFALLTGLLWLYLPKADFGTPDGYRAAILEAALAHLDTQEDSDGHHAIIDGYNAHEPLAQGYAVTYEDDWCATFVSYCAIQSGLTDIIPTECSCQRQIDLWKALDRWEEEDTYLPRAGDFLYYDWDVRTLGDSTGWADHVGIVIGTHGPFLKVIEGNKDDAVGCRYLLRWDPRIRGYGLPDYENTPVE